MRKHAMSGPPRELLVLPQKATLLQLRKAAAAALRDTYRMCERIEVRRAHPSEMQSMQHAAQAARHRHRLC